MSIQLYTPGDTFGQFTDKFNNNASEQWHDLAYPSNGTLQLTTLGGTVSKAVPLFTSMVVSGMDITHPVSGNYLSIAVAAGTFQHNAQRVAFAGGTAAITAGDATYSRLDALVVNTAGVLAILTGTPAAIPVMPTPAANQLHIGTIKVAPNADSAGGVTVVRFLTNVQLVAGTTSGQVPVWNAATQSYEPANIAGGMPASTQLGSMLVGDGSVFNEDLTVTMLADRFQLGQRFVELGDLGTAPIPSTTRLYQLGTGLYWGSVRLDNNGGTLPTGGTDGDVVAHNGTSWVIPAGIKLKKTNTTIGSENLLLGGVVPSGISMRTVIVDPWAARSTTGAGQNTLVGTLSGNGMGSSSQHNSAFGYNTGLTTGNFNTAIGSQAGNYGGNGNNNTWLGYMARAAANASNTVALGSGAVASDGGIAIGRDMNMTGYAAGLAGIAANGLILGGGAYAVADKSIYPNPLLAGTNTAGNNLLIYGGAGTGVGTPGGLYFRLYNAEASGTTPQATPENLLVLSKGAPAGANLVDIRARAKVHKSIALTSIQQIDANADIAADVVRAMVVADNTNIEATLPATALILDGHTIYVSAVGTSDYAVLLANSGQALRQAGTTDVTSLNMGWSSTARCMWDAGNAVWWVTISGSGGGGGNIDPGTVNGQTTRWDAANNKWVPNDLLIIDPDTSLISLSADSIEASATDGASTAYTAITPTQIDQYLTESNGDTQGMYVESLGSVNATLYCMNDAGAEIALELSKTGNFNLQTINDDGSFQAKIRGSIIDENITIAVGDQTTPDASLALSTSAIDAVMQSGSDITNISLNPNNTTTQATDGSSSGMVYVEPYAVQLYTTNGTNSATVSLTDAGLLGLQGFIKLSPEYQDVNGGFTQVGDATLWLLTNTGSNGEEFNLLPDSALGGGEVLILFNKNPTNSIDVVRGFGSTINATTSINLAANGKNVIIYDKANKDWLVLI